MGCALPPAFPRVAFAGGVLTMASMDTHTHVHAHPHTHTHTHTIQCVSCCVLVGLQGRSRGLLVASVHMGAGRRSAGRVQ